MDRFERLMRLLAEDLQGAGPPAPEVLAAGLPTGAEEPPVHDVALDADPLVEATRLLRLVTPECVEPGLLAHLLIGYATDARALEHLDRCLVCLNNYIALREALQGLGISRKPSRRLRRALRQLLGKSASRQAIKTRALSRLQKKVLRLLEDVIRAIEAIVQPPPRPSAVQQLSAPSTAEMMLTASPRLAELLRQPPDVLSLMRRASRLGLGPRFLPPAPRSPVAQDLAIQMLEDVRERLGEIQREDLPQQKEGLLFSTLMEELQVEAVITEAFGILLGTPETSR